MNPVTAGVKASSETVDSARRTRWRLRTKFLLSMMAVTAALTWTSLLVVRYTVREQVKRSILADLYNSVGTFQNFQRQRHDTLTREADMLADLPTVRAQMTTSDEATIQDASNSVWQLAGSDLFVLADRAGNIVALHTTAPGFSREMAQQSLGASLGNDLPSHWWFGSQHLYEVFLKPIYFGSSSDNRLLGFLAIGYEINDRLTAEVSRIAASQVAFSYENQIVRGTLPPQQQIELSRRIASGPAGNSPEPETIQLSEERYLAASLDLVPGGHPSVRLHVLKSYDRATEFLSSLNRLLLALGLTAIVGGSLLVFFLSHTFTRPLASLVSGVRALETGDFRYPLDSRGGDEVAEVTAAFDRMRNTLLRTQQDLLESERLATIGRMASSISHDLRHSLAAIVANAEFLCEAPLPQEQREELYQEVRVAVNQMTDLVDSLLEFSRTRESLRLSYGCMADTVEHVIQVIRSHPEFHHVEIIAQHSGNTTGWFDSKKLERVLYNLLINSCEAVPAAGGRILVDVRERAGAGEIRVIDNGRGIPDAVRDSLFEPFVSFGKENGTGLGLTVVQKIVQDHGGDVTVEKTSVEGTVFRLVLPLNTESGIPAGLDEQGKSQSLAPARREQPQ